MGVRVPDGDRLFGQEETKKTVKVNRGPKDQGDPPVYSL
jgi:hypothetical protein